jgi:hypothetical protein
MPIPLPNLDDRRWSDLMDEGRSLVPVYSSEWTDFNASDPGITLLEMLAAIAEMDIFQLNRIPERHKRKFLQMLGQKLMPPTPAGIALAFTAAGNQSIRIPADTGFTAANLPLSTVAPLTVVPCTVKAIHTGRGAVTQDITATFPAEPVLPFGSPPQIGVALYFGFDRPLPPNEKAGFMFSFASGPAPSEAPHHHSASVAWEYLDNFGWWSELAARDGTRSFSADGPVELTGPPAMRQSTMGNSPTPLFYIRVRHAAGQYDSPPKLLSAAFNAVAAEQSIASKETFDIAPGAVVSGSVPRESLLPRHAAILGFNGKGQITSLQLDGAGDPQFPVSGYTAAGPAAAGSITLGVVRIATGTGAPAQRAMLTRKSPVIESTVRVYSLEDSTSHTWERQLDFDSSSPADFRYVLDAATGAIQFGNGRHGRVPPEQALLFASYRATAAGAASVASGLAVQTELKDLARVTTASPAYPGRDAESLGAAIARAVEQREAPLRSITLGDYEAIAKATPGVDLARVSARANLFPALDSFQALGVVTVIIVPNMPVRMPRPSDGLIAAVRRHVNSRRVIGTRVEVIGPVYLQVAVNATVQSGKGQKPAAVTQRILDKLNNFLHPLTGGPDGTGWPFGRDVYHAEILQILASTPGVDHVRSAALIPEGCKASCGNISLNPSWLVTPGAHEIQVL